MLDRSYLAPIALVGAILGVGAGAVAQTTAAPTSAPAVTDSTMPHARHHHGHDRMRAALATLGLSADQKTKIAAIIRTDREAFRAGRSAQSPPSADERRTYREKMRADVEALLTADQKARLESALSRHGHAHPTGMMPMPQASPR